MGGLCGVSEKQESHEDVHRARMRPTVQDVTPRTNQGKLIEKGTSDKFKDMEEFEGDKTFGEGIKEVPAYKCTLAFDKLQELRDEFWASKKENRRVWANLKECCQTEASTAAMIITEAGLQLLGNNLRCVIQIDNPNVIYNVPNFCITDPIYTKDFVPAQKNVEIVNEKPLIVIMCNIFKNIETALCVTNKTKSLELKTIYAKKADVNLEKYKLRLLYKGQEIADDHCLFFHNVENNAKIQVAISELF